MSRLSLALLAAALLAGAGSVAGQSCTRLPTSVVLNARPWTASLPAAAGTKLEASCNDGYAAVPNPSVTCQAGAWTQPSPSACQLVCRTGPPPNLLPGGSWGNCAGVIPIGSRCIGVCSSEAPYGSPSITCTSGTPGGGWSNMVSGCSASPVCNQAPPVVINGAWTGSGLGAPDGFVLSGTCHPNFRASGAVVTTTCSGAAWTKPSINCTKGSAASPALQPSPSPALEPSPSPELEPSPSPAPLVLTSVGGASSWCSEFPATATMSFTSLGNISANAEACAHACISVDSFNPATPFYAGFAVSGPVFCYCGAACTPTSYGFSSGVWRVSY